MEAMKGFTHFETDHCATGSMKHLYAYAGHDLSEDLLLGVGEGVGFAYFHFKGQAPFLGGRAQPKPSMEEITGTRTGVRVARRASSSDAAAERALFERLEAGVPVMLQVDMGFLPYFDFGSTEYHFGGHVVVACGLDKERGTVLIADRDKDLHPVALAKLAAARSSPFKPFPPGRAYWDFDFTGFRPPEAEEVLLAVTNQSRLMLFPPIANIGVKGIRKASAEVAKWGGLLDTQGLRGALFSAWIFISKVGGTGGGTFRRMFSRFLMEAADICGKKQMRASAEDFHEIAEKWDRIADLFHAAADSTSVKGSPGTLSEISGAIAEVAVSEEAAWGKLSAIAG
jgi:hypothetical protein